MFSLNGSINIKNILIVNLIISLFVTLILAIKIGTVETIDTYNTCRHISDKTNYLFNICKNLKYTIMMKRIISIKQKKNLKKK